MPQETDSGQVAQGTFRPVACAYLAFYLACGEQGRVFVKNKGLELLAERERHRYGC